MLKELVFWGKFVLAVSVVIGAIVVLTYKERQADDKYKQECQNRVAQVAPNSAEQKIGASECQDPKQYMPWWHVLVAWPEGITAWLLMLTLGAIIWQAWETRKAAKGSLLSALALVNAERARIGFDITDMGRSFGIDGKNNGKTSARVMYAHGFTVELATGESLPSVPVYVGVPDDESEWIGPGEKFDLLTAPDRYGLIADLSDLSLCAQIREKKAILWAFGCIRYFDGVSSDLREKRFCFATSVDSAGETYLYSAGPADYRSEN